jgi:hypothetical protein
MLRCAVWWIFIDVSEVLTVASIKAIASETLINIYQTSRRNISAEKIFILFATRT